MKQRLFSARLALAESSSGFTLVELLVVVATLGILATIVLLAVNPGEQLRRGRDASRISAITQVGRALTAYFTAQNPPSFPPVANNALNTLVQSRDLKNIPQNPNYSGGVPGSVNCVDPNLQANTTPPSNYCYILNTTGSEVMVYGRMESNLYNSKCSTTGDIAWYVFSSPLGRSGIFCKATAPVSADVASSMTLL